MHVAIIGAGVTGLSAAYLLRKQGAEVTIFEGAPHEGGIGATFRRDGFCFDFGPHEFCTDNPDLIALLREVCGDDLLEVHKHTAQHFLGHYVRYPFQIVDVLKNIGPLLSLRAIAEVGWCRLRNLLRSPKDDSFESWTNARFGHTLYQLYFGPYTQKVWGMDPTLLDPRTASQRITIDSVWDLIQKTVRYHWFGAEDFKRTHSEFRKGFLYLRGGIGTLNEHLRTHAARLGATFQFGKTLAGIERRGHRVDELRFADGSLASGFDYVLSTIPLPQLVKLALPARAPALLAENHLPFRAMAFVFLRVRKPRLLDYHWIYYPDPSVPFQRLTEFTHFGAGMCPPDQTGVALEVSCEVGDPTWTAPDAQIAARCIDALWRLGHLKEEEVLGYDVVRTKTAYPLQVIRFLEKTQHLLEALGELENLVSIGRQGLFRYCNMNECIEMSMDVVPELLAGNKSVRFTKEGTWQGIGVTDRYERKRAGVGR
jgi:protoporphyrinogen oxidase